MGSEPHAFFRRSDLAVHETARYRSDNTASPNDSRKISTSSGVVMASGQVALEAPFWTRRRIPIVFNQIADLVGAGYIQTLARPRAAQPALLSSITR